MVAPGVGLDGAAASWIDDDRAAVPVAGNSDGAAALFIVPDLVQEMAAWDALPPRWQAFLQAQPERISALELLQKLRERNILP